MKAKLTQEEKEIIKEIKEISKKVGFGYDNLETYSEDNRIYHLNWVKALMIRSAIVTDHTLLDENLNRCIVNYFFGRKKDINSLWKTKKFKSFNYFILEKLSLRNKIRLVKNIRKIPDEIVKNIEGINYLRNAIVHAFNPDSLRVNRSEYKGRNIFSIEGFRQYDRDLGKVRSYLMKNNY
jgi:hypothetical protein